MTLHRTPVHHTAALMVRDGAIRWQTGKCVGGGWFVHASGEFPAPELVVALAELRQAALIVRTGPDLSLTDCCMNAGLRAGLAASDYMARRRDARERTQA